MKNSFDNMKIDKKYNIIVIDGLNMSHKFYWVMRNFTDKKGNKTGILYGVLNFIHSLKERFGKTTIIVAWDSKASKKKEISSDYKANRKREELNGFWEQIQELKILLSLYNVRQYFCDGYEADDIVAKVVGRNKGKKILLVSADNDWEQLMNNNIQIMRNNEIFSKEEIDEDNGFDCSKQTLIKSILGENGDNIIPAVKRVPKKIIFDLVKNSSDLEDIFKWCKKKKSNKWFSEILSKRDLVEKNFKLAKMLDEGYDICQIERSPNKKQLLRALKEHNMNKLFEKIDRDYNA